MPKPGWRLQILFVFVVLATANIGFRVARRVVPALDDSPNIYPRRFLRNDVELNNKRVEISEEIFRQTNYTRSQKWDVEVRVVASDRGEGYLLQTMAFLLEQQPRGSFEMRVCNVENAVFPDVARFQAVFNVTTIGKEARRSRQLDEQIAKEAGDYWNCLELTSQARYVLLLEDDSLVVPEFHRLLASLTAHLDRRADVDFVKLYHPKRLRKIPAYFITIAFCVGATLAMQQLIFRHVNCLILLIIAAVMSYNLFTYGSEFPAEVRYALTGSAYVSLPESCCTPAVVFRVASIPRLLAHVRTQKASDGHAKDHILDEAPLVGRQTDVNFVVHIGGFSSVRQRPVVLSDLNDLRIS